jgi:D-alanyl-lipoteichoic acid acyltransferase DltB (MBOAT superfamily)
MLFNSFAFLAFLPIVFLLYWWVAQKSLRFQNFLLLLASYVFYGWWDYRFLALIFISTLLDFLIGKQLSANDIPIKRKFFLALSIVLNLGLLGFFKYYNFFVYEGVALLQQMGFHAHLRTIEVILPVGISFYTFQTMSYTIDIYRKQLQPTKNFVAFAAFVAFFPQLVAGPIERAKNLLPQLLTRRVFDFSKARLGLGLIIWGFFKKIVIADSLAPLVDVVFSDIANASALALVSGAILFAFQIYGDFSGYSDIAIGLSSLFGIQLMTNFYKPYAALNIQEFWRRWHISLTTWFKDYLYIPLGGSRVGKFKVFRNVFLVFVISGLWHGANFTFLAWGFLHFIFYIPNLLGYGKKVQENLTVLTKALYLIRTFLLVTLAWVFFRAPSISEALTFLHGIFSWNDGFHFLQSNTHYVLLVKGLFGILLLIIYESINLVNSKWYNWMHFFVLVFLMIGLGSFRNPVSFIYFQF